MPFAWRIVKRKHAASALDGEGARQHGGRWNPRGVPLVYLAANRSLALLEILVHLDDVGLASSYVSIQVEFDGAWCEELRESELPDAWRESPPPPELQRIGEQWVGSRRSLLLALPSAILPAERIFLLNPAHSGAGRLTVGEPEALHLDPRLTSPRRQA